MMIDNEVSFTSLCYITVDYEGRIWLNRLADVEDDILHTPFKSERTDNYFENRDRLYRNDGPTALGTIGIWEWTAIPNRDNPAIDYVQSYYVKDYSPVRVVVLMAKSLDEVVEQLQNGTARTQAYFCDTLFCYEPKWGQFAGVLCRANEFNISDRCAKLSETVYSLPSYTISSGDIYNWDDRNLRFLKTLQLVEPSGYVSIGNTDEVIRTLILERTTWPLFKECIGATKAEWKHCKLLLEKICGESLYDAIVQKLNCTLDQAKQTVDDFVNRADALIKVGDIDVNVLAEIAKNHDELRELCEKAVSVEWHNSHAAEIAKAEAEVSEMEETISIAKKQHSELLAEIATKQGELDRLLAEIAQYESIGKETLVAVRQKIADAQKDMAGFIADISVFLPQSNATLPYGNPPASWQYSSTSGQYSDEDIELAESWRNEYDAIYQNLSCALGIEPDFCSMLTAFLYATHINNVPTLIAGPGGQDIAEVLSVSMYANGAGQLTLGDECDLSIVERISEADDSIVSVQNMFGKGWTDALPQKFTRLKKQIIWTHPYVEDMLVLEFALDRQQIDINPTRNSWLNRAGQSLAEGLRLAACQELDIEFTELVTGFRVRQNRNGDFVDIYLYDSLSSGAGYAVSIESSIRQLLTKTRELLESCTCDSACHRCLKHYRNQYIHSVLDRKAALDLLNWGETGARVSAIPYEKQQYLLKSLEQILQISGIHIDVNHESVWAEGRYSKKKVVVYPAMWTNPLEENTIFVSDAHLKYAKPYALKTILDSL